MDESTAPASPTTGFQPAADPLLQIIVLAANEATEPSSLQITLMLRGGAITGELIGVATYLELCQFSETTRQELLPPPDPDELPLYVHLRNAQFIADGERVPPTPSVIWRGRLSEVCGFSLGTLPRDE